MKNLSAVRCTVNHASITSTDLIEAADEIVAGLDGEAVTREAIAEACDLPVDCGALTSHVVSLIASRATETAMAKDIFLVVDREKDAAGLVVVYGEKLSKGEAERLASQIDACHDGRRPVIHEQTA